MMPPGGYRPEKPGPKWCLCLRFWADCYHSYCSHCGARTTRCEHTDVQNIRTRRFTLANGQCREGGS